MERQIPLEIERRFLIRLPDEGLLERLAVGRDWIEQSYLPAPPGMTERVRLRRAPGGEATYTHTVKRRISARTREEREERISQAAAQSLLERRDPALQTVCKTRWRIPHGDYLLELDRFPFWQDRALLEVELPREDAPFTLPDWVQCIREVTEDGAYTNRALARSVPYEALPGSVLTHGADPRKRTWAEIDLGALEQNYRTLSALLPPDCGCVGVVKADGYGHGAIPAALRLQRLGCPYLAVACLDEGYALRQAGVTLPILVLGPTPADCAPDLSALELTQAVGDLASARALSAALCGRSLTVHAKLETGMGRTGFPADPAGEAALVQALGLPDLRFQGVFTHFALADAPEDGFTGQQYRRFRESIRRVEAAAGQRFDLIHCQNSAAVLHGLAAGGESLARPGIALYGLYPDDTPTAARLRPVMRVFSRVAAITCHRAGDSIGYGRAFVCTRDTRVAVLPIGYGDGLHRALSGRLAVSFGGRRCPQLGRICMDMLMVDVTDAPEVEAGSVAAVLGGEVPAGELAALAGTIHYELTTQITSRVPRVYVG